MTRNRRTLIGLLITCTAVAAPNSLSKAADSALTSAWQDGKPRCAIVLPAADARAGRLVQTTINGYLREGYGLELPVVKEPEPGGVCIVAGTPDSNPVLARLVQEGAKLTASPLGDEGFQLLTHEHNGSRAVIIHGNTPRALKHGCQELVFYHTPATTKGGSLDWPLNIVMKPVFPYRGAYMLPCWAAHDSAESWQRVLKFNSELTLNRNWFWLDGFPVAGHAGEYAGTDLAKPRNVQRLLDLAVEEDMKILIGGGWFNWHHEKAIGKDLQKGTAYYLAYLDAFKNFHGFYIEPTGEGSENNRWRLEADALGTLITEVLKRRPEFEFAVAIGKFNNAEYRRKLASFDPQRVFWWWCWGDPLRDRVLDQYPSVLRWHVITRMSDFHGSMDPPQARERALAGVVTSYDPGQGFGNPWNGWGKLGVDRPRNIDPHTVPYFAHQYYYRERCWDLEIDEAAVVRRLQRRLFEADAPADAAEHYWRLSQLSLAANQRQRPAPERLAEIREFLATAQKRAWTPRTADTIEHMQDALAELTKIAQGEPR